METRSVRKILRIARKTRAWAELNRDAGGFPFDLNGMCAIAAMKLFDDLTQQGFAAHIAINNRVNMGHCFVIVDNHVVDVTATQFGKETVFFKPLADAKNTVPSRFEPSPWKFTKLHDSIETFRKHLKKSGWPKHQVELTHGGELDDLFA